MDDFKRRVYLSVGMIAASFLIFGLLFYFLGSYIDSAAKAIAAARGTKQSRIELLESLSALKRDNPTAEALQRKMDALLPPQDALLSFPQFIEGAARTRGVSANISFTGSPAAPAVKSPGTAPFSMSVTGSAANIAAFLNDLEFKTTKFLASFDSINFFPDGQGFRAEISGRAFFK